MKREGRRVRVSVPCRERVVCVGSPSKLSVSSASPSLSVRVWAFAAVSAGAVCLHDVLERKCVCDRPTERGKSAVRGSTRVRVVSVSLFRARSCFFSPGFVPFSPFSLPIFLGWRWTGCLVRVWASSERERCRGYALHTRTARAHTHTSRLLCAVARVWHVGAAQVPL